jgi:HTH-type transcriptional regulator / antitoxin HigA
MYKGIKRSGYEIVVVKTHKDYRRALKEIERLMTAKRNTPQGDRLAVLVYAGGGLGN